MSIVDRLFKVTKETAEQIADEIKQDQGQRRDAFKEQLGEVATLVERLTAEEADFGRFEQQLHEALMQLGLRGSESYLAEKRQVPERKMNDASGQVYKNAGQEWQRQASGRVRAKLDRRTYPTGVEISKAQMQRLNLIRNEFHGDWNYELRPQ